MGPARRHAGRDRVSAPRQGARVKYVAPNILEVTVTYLETNRAAQAPPPRAPAVAHRIELVPQPSVAFYRYLYNVVGEPWLWHERRKTDDATLAALLADPKVSLQVVYADGEPAGYAELNERRVAPIRPPPFCLVPQIIRRPPGPPPPPPAPGPSPRPQPPPPPGPPRPLPP